MCPHIRDELKNRTRYKEWKKMVRELKHDPKKILKELKRSRFTLLPKKSKSRAPSSRQRANLNMFK